MTPKQSMLAAARGQRSDMLPFAPRIDLWFHANKERGTLPEKYRSAKNADEIALCEGWALHKVVLEFMDFGENAIIDRTLGVYRIPTQGFVSNLSGEVERHVEKRGDEFHVGYRTPIGAVSGTFVFTDAMRRSGISVPWIKEHVLKAPADYRTLGFIFENMQVEPAYEGFRRWAEGIGENGMPVAYGLTAGSPMHHIMKILLDSTDFYYQHRDHEKEMLDLAEKIGVYFRNVLEVVAESPAEVILVGANFDDMLTYPPFFKAHIFPWLQSAADQIHGNGKLMLCHTDGENKGLMDLLLDSGMDIADSVCPFPMTKLSIAEYYRKWSDRITIFGGIPSNLMLKEATSDDQFEIFIESLFTAIAPGSRFILGIADTTPPDASFERLQYIQSVVNEQGRLPLARKNSTAELLAPPQARPIEISTPDERSRNQKLSRDELPFCMEIREAVMTGNNDKTVLLVKQSMAQDTDPELLLKECLLAPMDIIGEKFTDGTVFIPEVLLSARALNDAMRLLEPALAERGAQKAKPPLVLLGTVKGDLHDIGKNLVGIMLRSAGFRVKDLGINVPAKRFVEEIAAEKPDILALSALLTTTMPEFRHVIECIEHAGLRDKVKVMVGGAPVNRRFADEIGADGYGRDGAKAVEVARNLIGV